jgi:hypothetical protein
MNVYLDDDLASRHLVRVLRQGGHDVQVPRDVQLNGRTDPVHLTYCIKYGRVILSRNYRDFELLHILVRESGGHHPGVIVVREDNSSRDMNPSQILRAIGRLLTTGTTIADNYIILNHWR